MNELEIILDNQKKIMQHLKIGDDYRYGMNCLIATPVVLSNLERFRKDTSFQEELGEQTKEMLSEQAKKTREHIASENEKIMRILNSPLSKIEGIGLFIGGLCGNFFVNGLGNEGGWNNLQTWFGGLGFFITILIWLLLYNI